MPLDEIVGDARNPKRHDLITLRRSIETFGYTEAIIIDERTDTLIAGHGRVEALVLLRNEGLDRPDGITGEGDQWMVPVQTGWRSRDDQEAAAYLIASNRTVETGGWDNPGLVELLRPLRDTDLLLAVGFSTLQFDELEALVLGEQLTLEDEDDNDDEDIRSELLDLADLAYGEPTHAVEYGDVWRLSERHTLVVTEPHDGWEAFIKHLTDDTLLCIYPDLYLTGCETAKVHPLVLVQPSRYLAGHLLDKHASMFGPESVVKVG
jgi:hypothetical protein